MKVSRPDLAAGALCALCVVGIVLLAALHIGIPDVLTFVAIGALGVGGGTALNGGVQLLGGSPSGAPASSPPPEAVPGAAADPAATGVMRVATHAP